MPGSVAFVIDELERAGSQRQLYLMATGLADRGWRVQVICLQPILTMAPEFHEASVPVVPVLKSRRIDFMLLLALARFVRARGIDIVHAFSSTAEFYGGLAARSVGCRFVGSIRTSADPLPILHRLGKRVAAQLAHVIVANSRAGQDDAIRRRLAPGRKIHVVPNGVALKAFVADNAERVEARRALRLPVDSPMIVSVGRLVTPKGWDTIIEVARDVIRAHASAVFVAAGDGPLREDLDRKVQNLGLDERFLRVGECRNVRQLLAAGDIYLHASHWEGMSNAIMEAMAASRAVVASAVGGTAELIQDGKNGFLFPVGEVATAVDRVNRLIGDPDLRRAFGDRARLMIGENYSVDAMISRVERLYCGILPRDGT